nr:MerR family transcriptional regulator [Agrococcus sp. ARC_14]
MRSNELAALAGVSIRTLRHYHQIGLLEEPERSVNRYRKYTVHHLAKVLRIGKFTELGIPLSEVQRVIDDPVAAAELLEGIDAQAAVEIDRLARRRQRIAALSSGGALPDTPDALIPFASLFVRHASTRESRYESEQLALVAHLSGDPSLPWLVAGSAKLAAASQRYLPLVERFARIAPDAGPTETASLVDEMVEVLASAIDVAAIPALSRQATELLLAHQRAHLNDAQHSIMERAIARLDADSSTDGEAG